MKLTIFIFFIALLHASASTYGQQISISESDKSLKVVLHEIEQKTGCVFLYDSKVVSDQKVSINVTDVSVNEALDECFKNLPIDYKIVGKNIILQQKQAQLKSSAPNAPPHDIVGRVTNEHNQPLNGASVIVKRTQTGNLTDANGNFVVRNVLPTDTIMVQYIGYARQFIKVGPETVFKIVLKETTNNLDEVVVQAYGETTQRTSTGDIGTVSAKEIAKHPVMNVLEALQGQVPGVIVTNSSGYASNNVEVDIRGKNSIDPNQPSDPLYIIDGVPLTILDLNNNYAQNGNGANGVTQTNISSFAGGQSPLASINPGDIESISVLKDADATAIYGSRAANGVILITTKKGKAGKTHTEVRVTQGEKETTERFQLLNTQQYITMREDALKNDNLPVNINNAPDLINGDPNRYTNWENFYWGGKGNYTDAEVSMSGGDAQTTFRISGAYNTTRDITTLSGQNGRASLSLSLDHKSLNQRLEINLTASSSYSFTNQISNNNGPNEVPDAPPIYNSSGGLNFAGWDAFFNQQGANPFGYLYQPYSSNTTFLNSNLLVKYEILKNFTFSTSFGYNNIQNNQTAVQPIASFDPVFNQTGSAQWGTSNSHNLIVEPHFEYNKLISKGKLNVLAGATVQTNTTTGITLDGSGYLNDALLDDFSASPSPQSYYNKDQYKYAGLFARINYDWDDKYILNLNARRDGSSRFGPGRQYGNFGSVGGAYIFSEEKWVKDNLNFLSFGKLHASYGTTGNDQIGEYQYLTRWNFGYYKYNGTQTLTPLGHTDSLLHWEVNKKLELGLNLGFLKDRISLSAAWYINHCNDQLVQEPLASLTGFGAVETNRPADVENTGLEFILTGKIIDNTNFKWTSNFNIGFNRNKLISYPGLAQSPYASTLEIGQSLSIKHLLHYTGVDPLTGLYTFEDKNHDGQITISQNSHANDDTYPLDLAPKFDGSFRNTFSYKNWELSTLFYFRKQLGYNAFGSLGPPGNLTANAPLYTIQNSWYKPGDIAQYARLTTEPNDPSFQQEFYRSDGLVTDASFIRLQNLQLSYALPKIPFLKGITGGSIYIQGEDLFVLTKYKGPDPETQSFQTLPIPLTISLGVSLTL